MLDNYSPSINIIRDFKKEVNYLPTENSRRIFNQIVNNFDKGIHTFSIIGTYGTGKSAFLLALESHLQGKNNFFTDNIGGLSKFDDFDFYNIVGSKRSIIDALASAFLTQKKYTTEQLLKEIQKTCIKLEASNSCLVLVLDEFGKFLEFAASNDPDTELYFIQQLAELANDKEGNLLVISTLHQNFDGYALSLSSRERREWEKVKGRLKELSFNEPAEQLLYLAASAISEMEIKPTKKIATSFLKVAKEKRPFNFRLDIEAKFLRKLFPFDLISAMGLTIALQRYGQNERSLFNFLMAEEHLGLSEFKPSNKNPYYDLANVYDYLFYNYYSVLNSKYNPDYFQWSKLKDAIERVESNFSKDVGSALRIVKTIGLLNILGSKGAIIDDELLVNYSKHYLGIKDSVSIIEKLKVAQIIRYQQFNNRYKLFEGTDININEVLTKSRKDVSKTINLNSDLKPHFRLSAIMAKSASFKKGTPRLFEFKMSEKPITSFDFNNNIFDGIINLLFNATEENGFQLKKDNLPILYGLFKNTEDIFSSIKDIKAINNAFDQVSHDQIAMKELSELKENYIEKFNAILNDNLINGVDWYFNGEAYKPRNHRDLNKLLSEISDTIYSATPTFRNELMNKNKVSGSIHYAKKNLIDALVNRWNKPELDFPESKMPAEKTIYYSLLKDTGLHKQQSSVTANFTDGPDRNKSFQKLWMTSEKFLNNARHSRRKLSDFIDILKNPPFGLKDGFIEFWLIIFFFIKRDQFALFVENRYVPNITPEVLELIYKEAKTYSIKTFNVSGIKLKLFNKYREITQQDSKETINSSSFQETAKPFLVFYSQLSPYTKNTTSLSQKTLVFRDVIENATDLEKTFFEELPSKFGYSLEELTKSKDKLELYVNNLRDSIKELRQAEEALYDRIGEYLIYKFGSDNLSIKEIRKLLKDRYKSIEKDLLLDRNKIIYTRIYSNHPDSKAWMNSLAQALIGKPLNKASDKDISVFYAKANAAFSELDDMIDISQAGDNLNKRNAMSVQITDIQDGSVKKNVILNEGKEEDVQTLIDKIRMNINGDYDMGTWQMAFIKMLKESMK